MHTSYLTNFTNSPFVLYHTNYSAYNNNNNNNNSTSGHNSNNSSGHHHDSVNDSYYDYDGLNSAVTSGINSKDNNNNNNNNNANKEKAPTLSKQQITQ
eukprot:UN04272